jgi:hypothetical protein
MKVFQFAIETGHHALAAHVLVFAFLKVISDNGVNDGHKTKVSRKKQLVSQRS